MILRRVIAHFRRQEWTAIFIDFVIVVVGVFVGLQVNNWNAAQSDRSREAKYMTRIAEDLRADIVEIDEISRVASVRMAALTRVAWSPDGEPAPDALLSARGRIVVQKAPAFSERDHGSAGVALFILTTLEGNRSAYDALISTGDMTLIRDAALLRDIQSYYALADSVRDFEDSLGQSRLALVEAQRLAGLSPTDQTPVDELIARFAADPALRAAARNYWLYTNRHLTLMAELRGRAQALADRLGGRPK